MAPCQASVAESSVALPPVSAETHTPHYTPSTPDINSSLLDGEPPNLTCPMHRSADYLDGRPYLLLRRQPEPGQNGFLPCGAISLNAGSVVEGRGLPGIDIDFVNRHSSAFPKAGHPLSTRRRICSLRDDVRTVPWRASASVTRKALVRVQVRRASPNNEARRCPAAQFRPEPGATAHLELICVPKSDLA